MQYRIKEIQKYGQTYYYPQWKKSWFWRRFVWWGGEDGFTPKTVFHTSIEAALQDIEIDKESRKEEALVVPSKPIYHYIS